MLDECEMTLEPEDIQLKTVMDWVKDVESGNVVLPMIQRGSVWRPHQVLDLWDTMLRGMPLGAMMSTSVPKGTTVSSMFGRKSIPAPDGAISLLDGQQRTLAILSAWPEVEEKLQNPVVVWIDLADKAPAEYRFSLLATTRMQPYGYERSSMGGRILSKLATRERRLANLVYNPDRKPLDTLALWRRTDFMPWRAKFAIRMSVLKNSNSAQNIINREAIEQRIHELKAALSRVEGINSSNDQFKSIKTHFDYRIRILEELRDDKSKLDLATDQGDKVIQALKELSKIKFPIIPVRGELICEKSDTGGDPALAVLFKRVGSGGQPLTNEDYIFSVIKHYSPKTHDLVESLMIDKDDKPNRVAALYKHTDLVMAAVRLTLLKLRRQDDSKQKAGQAFVDLARIDKARFSKLASNESGFIKAFEMMIDKDGDFQKKLEITLDAIAYTDEFKRGLPVHALPWLVDPYLFDVLLAWVYMADNNQTASSKLRMVRFLLWGALCIVGDKAKASELCIKYLDGTVKSDEFPDGELIRTLIEERFAHPLPSPKELEADELKGLVFTGENNILRGFTRFQPTSTLTSIEIYKHEIYKRWWNLRGSYHHPLLLWLQREYVAIEFEAEPPLAGMTDETPYDFDHILPYRYWGDFRGPNGTPLPLRSEDNAKTWIGNAIGNVRVWSSRDNRSDSDMLPHLKLASKDDEELSSADKYMYSLIDFDLKNQPWLANNLEDNDSFHYWTGERASNFQKAVENRSFSLYKIFYEDLEFYSLKSIFEEALKNRGIGS